MRRCGKLAIRFAVGLLCAALLILPLGSCNGGSPQELSENVDSDSGKSSTSELSGSDHGDKVSIYASYEGEPYSGVMIDDDSEFEVYGYEDGVKVEYSDWTVLNPGPLPESGVATYQIECAGETIEAKVLVQEQKPKSSLSYTPSTSSKLPYDPLYSGYETVDIDKIRAMADTPYGKRIRYSFMVEYIYETVSTTEAIYGFNGTDPSVIFIMDKELGSQINDHTEITVEGVVVEDDASEHAGQHSLCVKVDNMTIDSRELEQFVKPNQISPSRRQ